MDIRVPAHGRLSGLDLHQALLQTQGRNITVDLSAATFVEPAGLIAIAVIVEGAALARVPVKITMPADSGCNTYLRRMRLAETLSALVIPHNLLSVREHPLGDNLTELRRFYEPSGLDAVSERVVALLRAKGDEDVQGLYTAINETGSNVIQHSERGGGYLALQRFPGSKDVAFAVGDSGIGVRKAYSKTYSKGRAVSTDSEALVLAAQLHESSTHEPGRGRGLSNVIKAACSRSGTVTILSGTAQATFEPRAIAPRVVRLGAALGGTIVQGRIAL